MGRKKALDVIDGAWLLLVAELIGGDFLVLIVDLDISLFIEAVLYTSL